MSYRPKRGFGCRSSLWKGVINEKLVVCLALNFANESFTVFALFYIYFLYQDANSTGSLSQQLSPTRSPLTHLPKRSHLTQHGINTIKMELKKGKDIGRNKYYHGRVNQENYILKNKQINKTMKGKIVGIAIHERKIIY